MAVQNAENEVVMQGHSMSWVRTPFDRSHTTFCSTLMEAIRLSCIVFEI